MKTVPLITSLLFLMLLYGFSVPLNSEELTHQEPIEPIFTDRDFIENEIGMEAGIEDGDGEIDLEFEAGFSWVVWQQLELTFEVPYGISFQQGERTRSNIGDIELTAKVLLCCETEGGTTFFSLRGNVALPTGNRSKEIDGEGLFGFALLGGYGFPLIPDP